MTLQKILYWIATAIMCLVFLYSASMYLRNYEVVTGFFKHLGFPIWLIYPMAILKILGVIAILSKKSTFFKELAYSGFLFNALLAFTSHIIAKDGGYMISLFAIITVIISWYLDKRNSKSIIYSK